MSFLRKMFGKQDKKSTASESKQFKSQFMQEITGPIAFTSCEKCGAGGAWVKPDGTELVDADFAKSGYAQYGAIMKCRYCGNRAALKQAGLLRPRPEHWSRYANKLRCAYCGKNNRTREWPERGDYEAIYFGREPGKFSLKVTCPHCNKDWYVYWYEYPGPIIPLDK